MSYPFPIYIRFGKKPLPDLHSPDTKFEIGKAITLKEGQDLTFIATGETVWRAHEASKILAEEGISCGVISMHTLKPLDVEMIRKVAGSTQIIITVEEHSIHGGLGNAVASVLLQERLNNPFKIIGVPDEYTVTGSQTEILAHYGISPVGLAESAQDMIQGKRGI
jgi:transketolase